MTASLIGAVDPLSESVVIEKAAEEPALTGRALVEVASEKLLSSP